MARATLRTVTDQSVPATDPPPATTIGDGIVVLRTVHRFGGGIAAVAEAIQHGNAGAAVDALRDGDDAGVDWIELDPGSPDAVGGLHDVRHALVENARRVRDAALAGDAPTALAGLGAVRVLCAHRHGPYGAATWAEFIESWLDCEIDGYRDAGRWYPGRPVLMTQNDYGLRLYNGDLGVIIEREGRRLAVFERRDGLVAVSPTRLEAIETVHAMTIHKSQGSQFDAVVVVLPPVSSPILTRELLYTAVTRGRRRLVVIGAEDSVRAAVSRPIARASGLRNALWG